MAARQNFRFCTSRDGTRIAIASIGTCPPLVRAAHWLSHVEYDLESPVWRPWLTQWSRDRIQGCDARLCPIDAAPEFDETDALVPARIELPEDNIGAVEPLLGGISIALAGFLGVGQFALLRFAASSK